MRYASVSPFILACSLHCAIVYRFVYLGCMQRTLRLTRRTRQPQDTPGKLGKETRHRAMLRTGSDRETWKVIWPAAYLPASSIRSFFVYFSTNKNSNNKRTGRREVRRTGQRIGRTRVGFNSFQPM